MHMPLYSRRARPRVPLQVALTSRDVSDWRLAFPWPIKAALPLPIDTAVTGLAPACCFAALAEAELPGSLSHGLSRY